MDIRVRVNRDHAKHKWTVFSLTHHHRIGRAQGLLMRDVTFVREGPSGWADGELMTWSEMQLDPQFHERVEARTVANLNLTWWPLAFRDGEFYLKGLGFKPLRGCSWLRILGSYAEVAEPVERD